MILARAASAPRQKIDGNKQFTFNGERREGYLMNIHTILDQQPSQRPQNFFAKGKPHKASANNDIREDGKSKENIGIFDSLNAKVKQ